ncbi:MAG: 2,3-dihydroxybiphenyl 1,2-dioxygenase [Gammaproteobacteria bacterium]|nr:MAG: 2,3-dihydroxybiphenyl 1,2-dioxygenase [Gammaproteobacteria bacterium]
MTGVLGVSAQKDDTGIQARFDEQETRLRVIEGDTNDIQYAGFDVADEASLLAVKARLDELGYATELMEPAQAKEFGALGLLKTHDPDGLEIHIIYGANLLPDKPFVSPAGVSGFVTGDQGFGHIVLCVKSMTTARKFYEQGLGFQVSDFIDLPMGPMTIDLTFLHCNPRHHTLALAAVPAPMRLLHFMLQAESIDDVGLSLERATAAECKITSSLGRHTNDQMLSFYVRSPSGFDIEFGFGARTVGEDWTVKHYKSGSVWGHKR